VPWVSGCGGSLSQAKPWYDAAKVVLPYRGEPISTSVRHEELVEVVREL